MVQFTAPIDDFMFIHRVLAPNGGAHDEQDLSLILTAAAGTLSAYVDPIRMEADRVGCRFEQGRAYAPPGFDAAYRAWIGAGWHAASIPQSLGGGGLPPMQCGFIDEMCAAANPAFAMYFGFAGPAVKAIDRFADAETKSRYIPYIASGEWTATMCLTEPQCGSDLSRISTRATPMPDGQYAISGTKMFISGGDHDLASNVVHCVIARVVDESGVARPGLGGLGTFLVRRDDGDGIRRVKTGSIENKMGLHANPTCVLHFDGSPGHRLDDGEKGMAPMFLMMNEARLNAALSALGPAHMAVESAVAYARDRYAGKVSGSSLSTGDSILMQPDVQRLVVSARCFIEGARFALAWASILPNNSKLVRFVTPILKAFVTDRAFVSADDALQIYGGHGYIRDHGIEQIVRDLRVSRIFEGANGVQAYEFAVRQLNVEGAIDEFFDILKKLVSHLEKISDPYALTLNNAILTLSRAILLIRDRRYDPGVVPAVSYDILNMFGITLILYSWGRMRFFVQSDDRIDGRIAMQKLVLSDYWAANEAPMLSAMLSRISSGGDAIRAYNLQ